MAIVSKSCMGIVKMVTVDENPETVPVDAPAGSLIMWVIGEDMPAPLYTKLKSGNNTEVYQIARKSLYSQPSAPTATDDATKGFATGSEWTAGDILYKCVDSTPFSAKWIKVTSIREA